MDFFDHWPHRWLYFAEQLGQTPEKKVRIQIPSVEQFQDKTWSPTDKVEIKQYLRKAPSLTGGRWMHVFCPLCGVQLAPQSWRSDGIWVWPLDLVHFIEMHHVRLPSRFLEHIRSKKYVFPTPEKVDWEHLDWPSSGMVAGRLHRWNIAIKRWWHGRGENRGDG